jgi:apolipoprotein N-acyltransferase
MLAISFPSASVGLLVFVALVPLILASLAARSTGEAFLLGLCSYAVTWLINIPWVVHVMSYYGGLPYALGIVLFIALSIVLGLYGAVFAVVVRLLKPGRSVWPWLLIAPAWSAIEYGRTYLLTGFPWNLASVALVNFRPLIIVDRFVGPYGIAVMIVAVSSVVAWLLGAEASGRAKLGATAATMILIAAWVATGILLVQREDIRIRADVPDYRIAAMLQPNITQEMRWDYSNVLTIFEGMRDLTTTAIASHADVVIWPESTIPLVYLDTQFWRSYIEDTSRENNVDIILGAVAQDSKNPDKIWNSAYLVHNGDSSARYDKMHLVPFGEYVPLRKVIFFAEKLVHQVGTFQFGTRDIALAGHFKYGPEICYEIVFPRIAAAQVKHGAEVLVTITNDAWFGDTSAPRQHLDMARMRAIEDDRYLWRAATTGISALVDPTGRSVSPVPLGERAGLVGGFAPRHSVTPYVRFGDWAAFLSLAVVLAALILRRKVSNE